MPRFSLLSFTNVIPGYAVAWAILFALPLASCDRQSEAPVQQDAQAAANELSDSGTASVNGLDRSHKGSQMPDFKAADPTGNSLNLASLKGKPSLINLWATWCAPCVTEMPMLDGLATKLKGSVRIVTISQDMNGAKAVEPFFAKHKFTNLEPWLDPESELAFHFGGANLPLTILYDSDGREVWRMAGDFDWSSQEADALVREAMLPRP